MTTYVAFIRGINVGGNKLVKMEDLRKMFSALGFENVSSYKAAGNIIFDAPGSAKAVNKKIDDGMHKLMGKETRVLLRTMDELKEMVKSDPFGGIKITPATRLYVTFLLEKPKSGMKAYGSLGMPFRILRVTDTELYSVVIISPKGGTVDMMDIIEKEFVKGV